MAEDEINIEDEAIALEDAEDTSVTDANVSSIVDHVMASFKKSEDYRYEDEQRWIRAYRNYRGLYGPDVQFTEAEKSRVFIKITKTKTLAAYGQIADVLFAGNKFPISIDLMVSLKMVMSYLKERLQKLYKRGLVLCKKCCKMLKDWKKVLVKLRQLLRSVLQWLQQKLWKNKL